MAEIWQRRIPEDGFIRVLRVTDYRVDSAVDFLDALSPTDGLIAGSPAFRGQANAEWGLKPSAFRIAPPYVRGINSEQLTPDTYRGQVRIEATLLLNFAMEADRQGLVVPDGLQNVLESARRFAAHPGVVGFSDWPPDGVLRTLALAQHSGIPTRLLDWTADPYIAAYFACSDALQLDQRPDHLTVWAVSPVPPVSFAQGASVSFALLPHFDNPNLRAQRGLMLNVRMSAHPEEPFHPTWLEHMLSRAEDEVQTMGDSIFDCVTVPSTEAPTILRYLRAKGIHGAALFPGYSGVARATKEAAFFPADDDPVYGDAVRRYSERQSALIARLGLPSVGPIYHPPGAQAVNGVPTIEPQEAAVTTPPQQPLPA